MKHSLWYEAAQRVRKAWFGSAGFDHDALDALYETAVNAIPSNQKYGPNFDLATWEPWVFVGKELIDDPNFEQIVHQEITVVTDSETEPDDFSEFDTTPGRLMKDFMKEFTCDSDWHNPTIVVMPQNVKFVRLTAPDTQHLSCYDVTLLIDKSNDEIIAMSTHQD